MSKLGYCSRSEAEKLISGGFIEVNRSIVTNPSQRVDVKNDIIKADGKVIKGIHRIYMMMNKPSGYVTTRSDEKKRNTVFDLIDERQISHIFPVGRLDMASEGLLLLTNDTKWANNITSPDKNLSKKYHVQINKIPDMETIMKMKHGVISDGEMLRVSKVTMLRKGDKNSWLEVTLHEGKNRQIRRILDTLEIETLRLIRVSIGSLKLGSLPKGKIRKLTPDEVSLFK